MQGCRGRPTGRVADPGGNLRARAKFAHFAILLLKWEAKASMWDPSSLFQHMFIEYSLCARHCAGH